VRVNPKDRKKRGAKIGQNGVNLQFSRKYLPLWYCREQCFSIK
jgi:hypothetical protein